MRQDVIIIIYVKNFFFFCMEWVIIVKPSLYSKTQPISLPYYVGQGNVSLCPRYIINNLELYISNLRGTKDNT